MNLEDAIREAWRRISKFTVIGLGSGTTIIPFIEAHSLYTGNSMVDVVFIPTSMQAKALLDKLGLRSGDLNSFPNVHITVDGCDAFDPDRNMIKGGGGCMLQEKMVSEASNELVILAAARKRCDNILNKKFPIEVHPLAIQSILRQLKDKLMLIECKVREGDGKLGPTITDSGNVIIDIEVDGSSHNAREVNDKLLHISGVLDTGLFLGRNPTIIVFDT
jgi:ribose 5-phosphate isomerase A